MDPAKENVSVKYFVNTHLLCERISPWRRVVGL